jgi:hypothetical protein
MAQTGRYPHNPRSISAAFGGPNHRHARECEQFRTSDAYLSHEALVMLCYAVGSEEFLVLSLAPTVMTRSAGICADNA